ncbi:DUF998 domain-containing protein [Actinoplanes sp. NPDC023714]|uniref:DUF998 domain-containing protein n=1 Tax=Actinoplanes sp. NPDC023714 TaxID=3154322 RepID=UPI0034022747
MFRLAQRCLVPVTLGALPVLGMAVVAGGWAQPAPFDWIERSVSAMAALDARHRYLTTAAMAGAGVIHVLVALGVTAMAVSGRALLALAGLFLLLAAAFPLPAGGGWSIAHAVFAGLAAAAMASWPAAAGRSSPFGAAAGPWVTVALFVLLGWYLVEVAVGGDLGGIAERAALAAELLWLAVTVRADARPRVPLTPVPTGPAMLVREPVVRTLEGRR